MRAYDYLKYSSVVFETCYMHLSYMYIDSDIDAQCTYMYISIRDTH